MLKFICFPAAITVFLVVFLVNPGDSEAQKLSLIRDAEIENTIRSYATPLFRAAGLEDSSVKIFLINDDTLNAFVAGGQNLFLNTGLILQSTDPNQLIGVIAHETGHIAGGHLARSQDAIRNATARSILALVLGGAVALGGRPDVGSAIVLGGQQAGLRSFLQYSRTQESAADQAALRLMDATKQSSRGLAEFLKLLEGQELLSIDRQDPYMRTHPLSRERISAVNAHVARSPYSQNPVRAEFVVRHKRMRAKLLAFLKPFRSTLRVYKETDNSLDSRYARAIAYYRKPDLPKALQLIDGLIADFPLDAYFHELKGQILFENGKIKESLAPYERAVELLSDSALLRIALARAQLELQDPALLKQAITNLRISLQYEDQAPFAWRQLAIAYGRNGDIGESSLALAEEALLKNDKPAATYHAGRAEKLLPRGSIGWLKAQDIREAINKKK